LIFITNGSTARYVLHKHYKLHSATQRPRRPSSEWPLSKGFTFDTPSELVNDLGPTWQRTLNRYVDFFVSVILERIPAKESGVDVRLSGGYINSYSFFSFIEFLSLSTCLTFGIRHRVGNLFLLVLLTNDTTVVSTLPRTLPVTALPKSYFLLEPLCVICLFTARPP